MELKEILSSIYYDKKPLFDEEKRVDKLYPAFVVNRCLSFFNDTILYANEMNCKWQTDKKMQFDFYRFGLRKKKRFSPWVKKETEENIQLIKAVYGYTDSKAQEVLNILGPSDLDILRMSIHKGGTNNKE
jgi:hypothetical protein